MTEMGWGAFLSKLLSFGCLPVITSSASLRIWIIASQNLSSSSNVSDSVGSISMQVEIGQEHVGGWKPKSCPGISRNTRLKDPTYLKALGKVSHLKASSLIKLGEVDKKLVGNTTVLVLVPEAVVALETASHVVGAEESDFGRVNQSTASEHLDVGPRNDVDRRASERCCGNGLDALGSRVRHGGVLRKER